MAYFIILGIDFLIAIFTKLKGKALSIFTFAFMAWLGGWADPMTTTDYLDYEAAYYGKLTNRFEWLYTYFSNASLHHGLTYAEFREILIVVTFVLLYFSVLRLTEKPILFVAIFMIFPFFNEVTQVRSFVAFTLILFAGAFFLKNNSVKNIVAYELLVYIAGGFHSSALIFSIVPLVTGLVHRLGLWRTVKGSIALMLVSTVLLFFTAKMSLVISVIYSALSIFGNEAVANTFFSLMTNTSRNLPLLIAVITIYVVVMYLLVLGQNDIMTEMREYKYTFLWAIIIIAALLIPLLVVSDQPQRFQRLGLEAAILIFTTIYQKSSIRQNVIQILVGVLILTVATFYFYGLGDPNGLFPKSIPFLGHFA